MRACAVRRSPEADFFGTRSRVIVTVPGRSCRVSWAAEVHSGRPIRSLPVAPRTASPGGLLPIGAPTPCPWASAERRDPGLHGPVQRDDAEGGGDPTRFFDVAEAGGAEQHGQHPGDVVARGVESVEKLDQQERGPTGQAAGASQSATCSSPPGRSTRCISRAVSSLSPHDRW